MAAELTGDIGTSQDFRPNADRTTHLLESGQHLGAKGQVRETYVGERIGIASSRDFFEASVVLDVRNTLGTECRLERRFEGRTTDTTNKTP